MDGLLAEQYKHLFTFFQMNTLCDVNLITDDGVQISAHKLVLANASPFFLSMFTGNFKESTEINIPVKEMDSELLDMIVKYAYTLELDINEDNIEKLLYAANLYDLKIAKELCYEYIRKNIDHKNCVSLLEISKLIENEKIHNVCWLYLLNNFSTILNSDSALESLYEFEIDDVVELIANDDLVIDSEEQIYDFIIGWITYDTNERSSLLPDLIKYLRLHLISKAGLQRISEEPLLKINKELYQSIKTEIYVNLRVNSKNRITLGRNLLPNVVLAVYGHLDSGYSCVKYMDIKNDDNLKWKSSKHLYFCPPRKNATIVVSENGIILAIGGTNKSDDYVNGVEELDLKLKKWVPTSQLIHPRRSFAVCTHGQFIYVVGGYNVLTQQFSNSVEYYNTSTKLWTEIIEPMPTARDSCSAIISNNKLYVFGGYDLNYLATVEYYDFKNKYWKELDPMPIAANSKMGITRMNNFIYLIAFSYRRTRIFKSDLNHFKWDEIPYMHSEQQFATYKAVVKKNDLLVFIMREQLTCERYDAEKKQWLLVDMDFDSSSAPYSRVGQIICINDSILKSNGIHL